MTSNVTTAAETNLITKSQMARAREIEFLNKFSNGGLAKLIEILSPARKVPVSAGDALFVYTVTGTLEDGAVPEGEIIPLSQFTTTKTPVGEITLHKWRKATSAEAIQKSGFNAAVIETDNALVKKVQKEIRADLFDFLGGTITGSVTATGVGLQAALADAWGKLQIAFEETDAETVYFVNPTDIAEYLKTAQITVQTAFGLSYVENFLSLGTVVITSGVEAGTFIATAKENIIMYYIAITSDLGESFALSTDASGYVGVSSGNADKDRAQIETLVMSGVTFAVEYAAGVVKGTITSETNEGEGE